MMDMKVNSKLVVTQRKNNAWSQQHLADVCGLSLRTIQRAENNGTASYETLNALCLALELKLEDLTLREQTDTSIPRKRLLSRLLYTSIAVVGLMSGVMLTSVSTASHGLQVSVTSQTVSPHENSSTFEGDVQIVIPADVSFEISVPEASLQAVEGEAYSLQIHLKNGHLLVAAPRISRLHDELLVTASKAQWHSKPAM